MAAQSYRAIRDELLRRIQSRQWLPGETIPGEVALAAEFGVARATANRALTELSDEGYLVRRRNAGTRVAPFRVRQARLTIPLIRVEIEAIGADYAYKLQTRKVQPMPNWLLARFGLSNEQQALYLTSLHFADAEPFVFEERWINLAAVPQARDADFAAVSANEWLVQEVPFTTAEFGFSATTLDADAAHLLAAAVGAASFTTERVTWLGQIAVTYARLSFRPGYQMVTLL
jgi:GntR family transcriptional regulator, histidine utilization repressor